MTAFAAARTAAARTAADWNNLGNTLSGQGRHGEAMAALQQAVALEPDNAITFYNLGNAYGAAGHTAEQIQALLHAIKLNPRFCAAAVNLSSCLRTNGHTDAARQMAELAVQNGAAVPHAHNALGNVLHDQALFEAACTCYLTALSLSPGNAAALANLARSLEALGRLAEALSAADAAIALDPGLPEAQLARATALLAMGDFARGWPAYEARFKMAATPMRRLRARLWRGEKLGGRTILIHAEQGHGDTLQFCRFVPLVAEAGGRVVLEVQPALKRLMSGLAGVHQVLAQGETLPEIDLHCPMMSLARIFAPDEAALGGGHAYLAADPALIAARPLPPADGARRAGLVWAGDSRPDMVHAHVMDRRRSLPLAAFAPLASVPGVRYFSLQMGQACGQETPPGMELYPALDGAADFADTAAVMAQLDLVITADTSCAHLAGALGRPVWLLSRSDACWRWMRERGDTPWYESMLIFRQERAGEWGIVIQEVRKNLLF